MALRLNLPLKNKFFAMDKLKKLYSPLFASLTLGLMPFAPEPHIVGKIKWIAGGAVGMGPMDWFDVALHGFPWVWLIVSAIVVFTNKNKSSKVTAGK
jgi:hypothetical protein